MNICCNPECRDPDCSGMNNGHCEHGCEGKCLSLVLNAKVARRTSEPKS